MATVIFNSYVDYSIIAGGSKLNEVNIVDKKHHYGVPNSTGNHSIILIASDYHPRKTIITSAKNMTFSFLLYKL